MVHRLQPTNRKPIQLNRISTSAGQFFNTELFALFNSVLLTTQFADNLAYILSSKKINVLWVNQQKPGILNRFRLQIQMQILNYFANQRDPWESTQFNFI